MKKGTNICLESQGQHRGFRNTFSGLFLMFEIMQDLSNKCISMSCSKNNRRLYTLKRKSFISGQTCIFTPS